MAFWGCSFVFDGVPCEEYDLMLYDSFGGTSQEEGKFANTATIHEDKVNSRWKPHFYGTSREEKLSFSLIFGVNHKRIDSGEFLDRHELESISSWLLGHNNYKWLEILQEDLEDVRYNCIVTSLDIIEFGTVPWALKATIECDSPYAYAYPTVYEYVVKGTKEARLFNESSLPGYYKPVVEIDLGDSRTVSITNLSDGGRKLEFSELPSGVHCLRIDNDHCVITTDDGGINPYKYFNFNFFRLLRGCNDLVIDGDCTVRILCEFPINTGS